MTTEHKYLVNCQEGANNVERATVSFVLAASASKTAETAVFLTADASRLCTRGGADGLHAEGMEPLDNLIEQFIGNGGKLWLCPVCAKAKGITEDELREGAELAGAPKTMDYLANGAHLLA